jgi:hypothetical protein
VVRSERRPSTVSVVEFAAMRAVRPVRGVGGLAVQMASFGLTDSRDVERPGDLLRAFLGAALVGGSR